MCIQRMGQEKQSSAFSPPLSLPGGVETKQDPEAQEQVREFRKPSQAIGFQSVSSLPCGSKCLRFFTVGESSFHQQPFSGGLTFYSRAKNRESQRASERAIVRAAPFCKGRTCRGGSESSKGLQRAGVSGHFLAREGIALSPLTGPDRGVWRRLYLQKTRSACNHLPRPPAHHVARLPQCALNTGAGI